jgi:tellurite resistance protein TerB
MPGFLDKVKKFAEDATQSVTDGVKRFKNTKFLDAVIGGCVYVMGANGVIKPEEKQKMIGFINLNEALKVFDNTKVVERFNHFVGQFEFDANVGKGEVFSALEAIKDQPDQAKLAVQVLIAVCSADDDFDAEEQKTVVLLAKHLNLEPSLFGLDANMGDPSASDTADGSGRKKLF